MGVLGIVDWLALAVWAALWMGFSIFVRRQADAGRDLNSIMAHYRHAWMQQAWTRDNRITDIALMGNLMHSATFFSSTTLLVVGALFAFLGTVERAPDVIEAVSKLPFGSYARDLRHIALARPSDAESPPSCGPSIDSLLPVTDRTAS